MVPIYLVYKDSSNGEFFIISQPVTVPVVVPLEYDLMEQFNTLHEAELEVEILLLERSIKQERFREVAA